MLNMFLVLATMFIVFGSILYCAFMVGKSETKIA